MKFIWQGWRKRLKKEKTFLKKIKHEKIFLVIQQQKIKLF